MVEARASARLVEVRAFNPADVATMELQPVAAFDLSGVADWKRLAWMAAEAGPAWSAVADGRVLGCAGFGLMWPGRAATWCFLARDIPKPAWIAIHRAVTSRLAQMPALGVHRIEADVLHGYTAGHRWVRMLGFEHEGLMRAYGPARQDFHRYAWVRE